MEKESPEFDYCYCNKCVTDFMKKTGINIKEVDDSSQILEWKQFRYNLIPDFVNRLSNLVHSKNELFSSAVYPVSKIAKKIVRQEWPKWNVDALFFMSF